MASGTCYIPSLPGLVLWSVWTARLPTSIDSVKVIHAQVRLSFWCGFGSFGLVQTSLHMGQGAGGKHLGQSH